MSNFEFDPDRYFRNRSAGLREDRSTDSWVAFDQRRKEKEQQVEEANLRKLESLSQKQEQWQHNQDSWLGQTNIHERSIRGGLLNTGASMVSAGSRVIGEVGSAIPSIRSMDTYMRTPEAHRESYARYQQGEASEKDMELLNQRFQRPEAEVDDDRTFLERLQQADEERGFAERLNERFDISGIVHEGRRDRLSESLDTERTERGLDQLSEAASSLEDNEILGAVDNLSRGLANLVREGGRSMLENPGAVAEYTAELAPQLALGYTSRVALATQSMGYAMDAANRGIEKYQEEHDGAYPDDETIEHIFRHAIYAGTVNHLGSVGLLRTMRAGEPGARAAAGSVASAGKKAGETFRAGQSRAAGITGTGERAGYQAGTAIKSGAEAISRTAADTTFRAGARRTAGAGVEGFGIEAVTEGIQTRSIAEAELTPASPFEIFEGVVIGGASGATASTGGRGISEAAGTTEEAQEQRQIHRSREQLIQEATGTGDVSALMDPSDTTTYSPLGAVRALVGHSLLEETTAEQRQADSEQITQIISGLQESLSDTEALLGTTPERFRQGIRHEEQQLEQAQTPEERETAQARLDVYREQLSQLESLTPAQRRQRQKELDIARSELEQVRELAGIMERAQQPTEQTMGELLEILNREPSDEVSPARQGLEQDAADQVIRQAMRDENVLTPEQATQLSENPHLSEPQRQYLRAFSEARLAQNLLKDAEGVRTDIFEGGDGFRGLPQFRQDFSRAMEEQDRASALRHVQELEAFAESRRQKHEVATQALQQSQQTRQPVSIVRDAADQWTVRETPLSDRAVRREQGLNIHPGSEQFVTQTLAPEVDAVRSTAQELRSAFDLRFGEADAVSEQTVDRQAPTESTQETPTTEEPAAPTPQQQQEEVADAPTETTAQETTPQEGETESTRGEQLSEDVAAIAEGIEEGTYTLQSPEAQSVMDSVEAVTQTDPDAPVQAGDDAAARAREDAIEQAAEIEADYVREQARREETVTTQETVTQEGESGRLEIMNQPVETVTPENYQTANLVRAFFNQVGNNPWFKTAKALVAQKDFLSLLRDNSNIAENYISQEGGLTAQQHELLQLFSDRANEWNGVVKDLLKRGNEGYYYNHYMNYLMREDAEGNPDLDENTKTAISLAAFTWLTEEGGHPPYNDDQTINRILHREDTQHVSVQERNLLTHAGLSDKLVINSLGERVSQALGLKARKNAPVNEQSRLNGALGSYALALLVDQGLVRRHNITVHSDQHGNIGAEPFKGSKSVSWPMVHVMLDDENRPVQEARQIHAASSNTQGVLTKVFGVESVKVEPSTQPIEYQQDSIKRTDREVPDGATTIQSQDIQKPWNIEQDMFHLVEHLNEGVLEAIAGITSLEDTLVHEANRAGVEGRNDGLRRELDEFMQFAEGLKNTSEGLDTALYLDRFITKVQRMHYKGITPQGSKIVRHLLGMQSWNQTIDKNDAAEVNNFKLAIAEGFGVKTDKKWDTEALREYEQIVQDQTVQDAVAALQRVRRGETEDTPLTPTEQQAIENAVAKGGENFHTLHALSNLAAYQMEGDNFTASIFREVDGVTNGPMLALLLTGGATDSSSLLDVLNRGGFFETTSDYDSFKDYKNSEQAMDLYEVHAKAVYDNLLVSLQNNKKAKAVEQVHNAVFRFMGTFVEGDTVKKDGRKAMKSVLTPLAFGSSLKNSIKSMANAMIEDYYNHIEDIANDDSLFTEQEKVRKLQEAVADINLLIERGGKKAKPFSLPQSVDDALKTELSPAQVSAVIDTFQYNIGPAVEGALETHLGHFMEERKTLNRAAQLAFEIYEAAYQIERERFTQELIQSGEIKTNKKNQPLHDLTQEQDQMVRDRIRHLEPVVHTYFSKGADNLSQGIYMSKEASKVSQDSRYSNEAQFSRPIKQDKGKKAPTTSSLTSRGVESHHINPGVAVLISMIHSTDSAIAQEAYGMLDALNVHDALGLGLDQVSKGATALNRGVFNITLDYSVPLELHAGLARTLEGFHALMQTQEGERLNENQRKLAAQYQKIQQQVLDQMNDAEKANLEESGLDPVSYLVTSLSETVYHGEKTKLETMSNLKVVDQYAFEGGGYQVTNEDRQKAQQKLNELNREQLLELSERAQELNIWANRGDTTETTETDPRRPVNGEEDTSTPETTRDAVSDIAKLRVLETNERNKKNLGRVQRIRKLIREYAKHGNYQKAFNTAFSNVSSNVLEQSRKFFDKYLSQQGITASSFRDNTNLVQRNLVDALVELVPQDQRPEGLTQVHEYLTENQETSFEDAVNKLLNPVQAKSLIQYMERNYNANEYTVWGQLGDSTNSHDDGLVQFLENNPNPSKKQLINHLQKTLAQGTPGMTGRMRGFTKQLLGRLDQVLDDNLQIQYVTAETTPDETLYSGVRKARGWYEVANGAERIVIKSPDFLHSGVTMETLVHELVHAAIEKTIAHDNTPVANELRQDLENLLTKSRAYIQENGIEGYNQATLSISELAAWGMTNAGFQNDVLMKVEIEDTRTNSVIDGMREFINKITRALFRGKNKTVQNDGMSYLIARVSALTELNQEKSQNRQQTLRHGHQDDPLNQTTRYTTEQVFDALGQEDQSGRTLDPFFVRHLAGIQKTIVDKVHGPYGIFTQEASQNAPLSAVDVYFEALRRGEAPFASRALAQGLALTDQQAFVLEQVEVTMQGALETHGISAKQLYGLYKEARQKIRRGTDLSEADWDAIFVADSNEGMSNYLSRFAALALVYEPLYSQLDFRTATDNRNWSDMTFSEVLGYLFQQAMDFIGQKIMGTFEGQQANQKLMKTVQHLADVEARKKTTLARKKAARENAKDNQIKQASQAVRNKIREMGESEYMQSHPNVFVRATGSAMSTVAGERVDTVLDVLQETRQRNFNKLQGFASAFVTELRGANEGNRAFYVLNRYVNKHQRDRKNMRDQTTRMVLESFADEGSYLTTEDKTALTKLFLRTGAVDLMDSYSINDIGEMATDANKRKAAITQELANLQALNSPYHGYYERQIKNLAHHLVTGEVVDRNLVFNAHNIAHMYGTAYKGQVTNQQAKAAMPIIDRLVSLYAMDGVDAEMKVRAQEVVRKEQQRGNESGFEFMMKLHKGLQEQSSEALFENDMTNMRKGYVPEVHNPYLSIRLANAQEGAVLRQEGWSEGSRVKKDPSDVNNDSDLRIYTRRDGGLQDRVTGNLSYTGDGHARGTQAHGSVMTMDGVHQRNQRTMKEIQRRQQKQIDAMMKTPSNYDPRKQSNKHHLVPTFDSNGDVTGYRYIMNERTRDNLLERNNDMDLLLGTMAANIYDKPVADTQNRQVIQALKDQYDAEFINRPQSYVKISPKSSNPELREMYRLLPHDTKKAIREIWGRDEMLVREDLVNINFGFKKYSLSDMWGKDSAERNVVQNIFVNVTEGIFGKKAALRIKQAEDVNRELIQMTKDNLVTKNFAVLMMNITSGVSQLLWFGVSPKDIVRNVTTAIKGTLQYRRDEAELMKLKRQRDIGYAAINQTELDQRIIELEDALKRNPMHEMVEEGMYQTIVEDIDQDNDPYSYKSLWMRKVDKVTQNVPESVKTVGKVGLMTHDTKLYKFMNQATMFVDLASRYTLHQHMTTRTKDPLSTEDSLLLAQEAFVDYDIPTHKGLQYMNDMGLILFSKYYIRIQKILMKLMKDNPAQSLGMVAFGNLFPSVSILPEVGVWERVGNPLRDAGLAYPGSITATVPFDAAGMVLNR